MTFKNDWTLSINHPSLLVVARRLNQLIEKTGGVAGAISQTATDGAISLNLDRKASTNKIEKSGKIVITGTCTKSVLRTGAYAILRETLGQLTAGETKVDYAQDRRVLMLDMGRKFFSKEMIMKLIDALSFAQFNFLQLHFSENEGFRIECETAPEIVSEEHLTKAEIREIIQYAQFAGIEIIPDFDSPGHLKQILKDRPEWQLVKKNAEGDWEKNPTALDISNPEAVDFILSIYREFAELFSSSRYFHIGADEFVDFDEMEAYPEIRGYAKEMYGEAAEGIDAFVGYVNRVIEEINGLGFIPQVWNDGFFRLNRAEIVKLSKEVEISYWTKWNQNMAPVDTFVEKGYTITNFNDNYFYYVLGEHAGYTYPEYEKITDKWTPEMWPQDQVVALDPVQLPGVAVAIWSDRPEAQTEEEVLTNASPILFAVMQKQSGEVFATKTDIDGFLEKLFK
ncbi:family 20 glycosylhydrolase [Enterococcus sp. LJL98]